MQTRFISERMSFVYRRMLTLKYLNNSKLLISLIFFLMLGILSCTRNDEFPINKKVICDAEKITEKGKFIAANDSTEFFDGGYFRSSIDAFSGKHSALTIPQKKAFAFGYSIKHSGPDNYFKVSVWRKSKDGKGVLVAASAKKDFYYLATGVPVEKHKDGWEKLELEVYTPPNFGYQGLKFYVWNNGTDTVYFDDMYIERKAHKTYPDYTSKPFAIIIDSSDMIKIEKKRLIAFENGILETTDKDWVKGFVFYGDEPMKARFRLKGDWLDHLHGDKWSFRIKMRKDFAWNRLRAFSIQTPASRNFLLEWEAHQLYHSKDMLTTRYGFMPVSLNNKTRGLYAWEEHFVKQLLEYNNRREGPIIKFSEDAFWQIQKIHIRTGKWQQLPYFEASVIKPFGEGRTMNTPTLNKQFKNAQKLLYQYKHNLSAPAQIFDMNKLANYYALLELTQARHGMFWHNLRFYYNPVIDKLELIAFDGYSHNVPIELSIEENFLYQLYNFEEVKPEEKILTDLFLDSTFLEYYFRKLEEVTDADFINKFSRQIAEEQNFYDSLLRLEFPNYFYDKDFIKKSASSIRTYLPDLKKFASEKLKANKASLNYTTLTYADTSAFDNTPEYFVNVYREALIDDSISIKICNYFPQEITILGVGESAKFIDYMDINQSKIPAYFKGLESPVFDKKVDSSAKYLYFMLNGRFDTYKVPINPWPYPNGFTARQKLEADTDIDNYTFITKNGNNELVFKTGQYQIDQPVIIPKGYRVVFNAGTTIDFIESAMFISYSPVFANGTINQPVTITSSDFSANAFTVLQAEKRSKLEHVVFENLNTLDYQGWTHTGAVTFYESDVDINHVKFYRNQCEDALNIIRSDFNLEHSIFSFIYSDAFDSDFSTGNVTGVDFENIGNDAIDFSGSMINITNVTITDAGDKGISGGEDSKLIVENVTIKRANIGIASKDLSFVQVSNSHIIDCNYGLVLLRKKPEYGPATLSLKHTELTNSKTEMLIEKGSKVIADGNIIEGTETNVSELFY